MRVAGNVVGRIPALDGIRGLAITLVLWWHFTKSLHLILPNHPYLREFLLLGRFTWSGVDLFFVLSGFLIGGILLDSATSPSFFRTFYVRRFYRIVPLYTVLLVTVFFMETPFRTARSELLGRASQLLYYFFFLQNFKMAAMGVLGTHLLAATWSLAVEEQFYLTLPLTVRFVPQRYLWRVVLGAALVAPFARILVVQVLHGHLLASYVLTPCRADALCLGVLAAIAARNETVWTAVERHRAILYTAFGLAMCCTLGMILGVVRPRLELEYTLLAILYCLLLLCVLVSRRLSAFFCFAPLRFMGIIAYGLYLFHPAVMRTSRYAALDLFTTHRGIATSVASVLGIGMTVGLATISWYCFEKPLVKRGHRYQYWRVDRTVQPQETALEGPAPG